MSETLSDIDADLTELEYDSIADEVAEGDEVIRANYCGAHDGWKINERGTVDRIMDSITMAVYLEEGGQLGATDRDNERVFTVV